MSTAETEWTAAAVVEAPADGREILVLNDLAREAVAVEQEFFAALTQLWNGSHDKPDALREFVGKPIGKTLLPFTLPLVAHGSAVAHRAVVQAITHVSHRMRSDRSGRASYLYAGNVLPGRLVWALAAQALTAGRFDFLSTLDHLAVRSGSDGETTRAAASRGLRSPHAFADLQSDRIADCDAWLDGADLTIAAPYLSSAVRDQLEFSDLVLAVSMSADRSPVFSGGKTLKGLGRLVGMFALAIPPS